MNYSPWEGLILEKFMEDCLLWKGLEARAGKGVWSAVTSAEGVAETWE